MRRNVLLLCVSFAAFGTVWGAFQAVTAELQHDYGFSESQLGLLLLLTPLFGVPAALSGARIVARFGSRPFSLSAPRSSRRASSSSGWSKALPRPGSLWRSPASARAWWTWPC